MGYFDLALSGLQDPSSVTVNSQLICQHALINMNKINYLL